MKIVSNFTHGNIVVGNYSRITSGRKFSYECIAMKNYPWMVIHMYYPQRLSIENLSTDGGMYVFLTIVNNTKLPTNGGLYVLLTRFEQYKIIEGRSVCITQRYLFFIDKKSILNLPTPRIPTKLVS